MLIKALEDIKTITLPVFVQLNLFTKKVRKKNSRPTLRPNNYPKTLSHKKIIYTLF